MAIKTPQDFASLMLSDMGAPVTPNNINTIVNWIGAENPWPPPRNNPLNNGLGSGGGSGLGSYPDLETAARYAAQNLSAGNNGYPAAQAVLMSDGPDSSFRQAISASSWASGHYAGTAYMKGLATAPSGGGAQANVAGSASSTGAPAAPAEPTTSFNIPGIGKVQATGQQATALATFETNLQAYGFSEADTGQLTKWAWGEFTAGTDPSQIAIDFQGQPAFVNQFPGFKAANIELTGSGNPAMSVAQYADYQHQALALAHAAGLPDGFINKENIGILAGGNVSHDELNQRINDAMSLAYNSTDAQRQAFNGYFGLQYNSQINQFDPMSFGQQNNPDFAQIGHGPLTTGQIAAIALDPTVAEPLIKNQITAAQLGGAYQTAGLGIAGQASGVDKATALQIAQSGVSQAAILGSANKNAVYAPLQTALPGQSGATQVSATQLAAGDLLGDTNAQRALQVSQESRIAPFKGGGGDVATNKGVVGAGSSSGTGSA